MNCPVCKRPNQPWLPFVPEPPSGRAYLISIVSKELSEKIGDLDANGHWERELSQAIERTIEDFYQRLPIDLIRTPRSH